jgi:hypothetical protein
LKGEIEMTQMKRKTVLQQGAVSDVMSHLSGLPEHEKSPGALVTLSDIFRSKEYVSEINAALKKGYSFDDLAKIFTEKCGVSITARQMKYHHTRMKNRAMKKKSAGKAQNEGSVSKQVVVTNPHQEEAKEQPTLTDLSATFPSKSSGIVSGDVTKKTPGFGDFQFGDKLQ